MVNGTDGVIHIRELIEELKRDLGMIEQETTMPRAEVSDEMVAAFKTAWHATPEGKPGDRTRAGLQAAMAWTEQEQETTQDD